VVSHRKIVVPQLGATGVNGREVKRATGFEVVWGPIRAGDIAPFLENDMHADDAMRMADFPLVERAVLVPVEFWHLRTMGAWAIALAFVLSGIGPGVFSIEQAAGRGLFAILALALGCVAGGALTPILLPWIPSRIFAVKGAIVGLVLGSLVLAWVGGIEGLALVLASVATSSWMAMNFTGSTPYTSPTGVEWEMRRAIPAQIVLSLVAIGLWLAAPFM
jgi:hypothetical protein